MQSGFRSLPEGFEMYFLRDFDYDAAMEFNPYILAGLNGSGKSNVLEALAEIFFHLDCIYLTNKPDYFDKNEDNPNGFDSAKSRVDAYELEYFSYLDATYFPEQDQRKTTHIRITKSSDERPQIEWLNEEEFRTPQALNQIQTRSLLPEYVVGYASGNNETLSIPFFKSRLLQYDQYFSDLESQSITKPQPDISLIYLDEYYSQSILLTNLLMWRDEEGALPVLQPFREYVQLVDVDSFRLKIRLDKKVNVQLINQAESEDDIPLLQNLDVEQNEASPFVRSYLEKLRRCATVHFEEEIDNDFFGEESYTYRYLVLDYNVNEATKEAFQFHFEDPLKLFELFQLLLSLDICELSVQDKRDAYNSTNIFLTDEVVSLVKEQDRILRFKDFKIKKEHLQHTIFTKALSDGEHQFLHSLGLCLLFKDTRSLFLLDEPETHFNPDWKAKFISSIRLCFQQEEGDFSMREMLITSHSPFLISDSKSEYVLIFERDPVSGKVREVRRPDRFQTFGSSVNKIAIRIYKMPNTIGEYAQKRLNEYKAAFESMSSAEQLENLLDTLQSELGESVETVLFINKIIQKIDTLNESSDDSD